MNAHAVALGRLGGLKGGAKGGRARAAALSPARRREISCQAAAARWLGQLPELVRPLFWEYRLEDLRLSDDLDQVVLKVLAYGRPEHVEWLRRRLGEAGIRRWICRRKGRGLTVAQISPWVSPRTARLWQAADPNARIWENR
jgi:hypothetical protein